MLGCLVWFKSDCKCREYVFLYFFDEGAKVGGNIISIPAGLSRKGHCIQRIRGKYFYKMTIFSLNTGSLISSRWQTRLTNNDTIINRASADLDTIINVQSLIINIS